MLIERAYTANEIKELHNLKDEKIKGVIEHDKKTWIIFESGFAFWFNNKGAFSIEKPDTVNKVIDKVKGKLLSVEMAIKNVLEIAGEV
jgi:hypothetical protein